MAATPFQKKSLLGTSGDNIKVFVRPRPLLQKEIQDDAYNVLITDNEKNQIITEDGKIYQYDGVFEETSTQEMVYKKTLAPLISQVLVGQNVTVLAYGQTGSGKTFTMGTDPSLTQDNEGLLQRALEDLLEKTVSPLKDLESELNRKRRRSSARILSQTKNKSITLSFLEIYNESIYDLLAPTHKLLDTKPDGQGGVFPVGAQERTLYDADEGLLLLKQGNKLRRVSSTLMNKSSSRSHALITFKVQSNKGNKAASCLRLVDLAGAEGVGKAQMAGQQFSEGVSINTGLLTLGKVLTALSSGNRYIPYRESIVTRLLRDSLGGSSKTVMIACVSPADSSLNETLNILRYAEQARNVRAKPIMAPPSTIKHGVKRRLGDVSATPSSFKKRFHSKSKTRPTHNTTVSTPGNTPFISKLPDLPLSSTFTSADIFNSTTLSCSEDDTAERKLESCSVVKPLFVNPSPNYISKPPVNVPVSHQIPQSYMDEMASLKGKVDKLINLFSETGRKKKDKKNTSVKHSPNFDDMDLTNEICSESSTPDLHKTLANVLLEQIDMKKVVEQYTEKTVQNFLLQPRRSKRLSVASSIINLETTTRSPLTNITNVKNCDRTLKNYDKSILEDLLDQKSASMTNYQQPPISSTARMDKRVRKSTHIKTRDSLHTQMLSDIKLDLTLQNNDVKDSLIDDSRFYNDHDGNDETVLINDRFPSSHSPITPPFCKQNVSHFNETILKPYNETITAAQLNTHDTYDDTFKENDVTLFGDLSVLPIDRKLKQDPTSRRRSSRRSAIVATQRNFEIFNNSPVTKIKKNLNSSKLNNTIKSTRRSSTASLNKSRLNVTVTADKQDQWDLVVSPTLLKQHNKKILNVLNKGSLKELQTLPTIGPKTAMVVYNFRNMYGTLKKVEDLQHIPGLAKNFYSRFMKANLMNRINI